MTQGPQNQPDPAEQPEEEPQSGWFWSIPLAAYFLLRAGRRRKRLTTEQLVEAGEISVEKKQAELRRLGQRLVDGEISTRQFHRQSRDLLTVILTANFMLGRGGQAQMDRKAKRNLQELIRNQLRSGRGENGSRYGLRSLINELRREKISPARFLSRLDLYGKAGTRAFWRGDQLAHAKSNTPYGIRILDGSNHCKQCPQYAAMPPRRAEDLVLPTERCDCRNNCRCRIVWLTLEEAVARGMRV